MPVDLRFDLLTHLAAAAVLGGLVGWEREASGKPAGLRTNILICVGAALLTDLSLQVGSGFGRAVQADPTRIAAQIVSGIGFLGAGTIIQARGAVHGLTTAATLWVVAAIGMAVGSSNYVEAMGGTVLVLAILFPLAKFERWVERRRRLRRMVLQAERDHEGVSDFIELIQANGLTVRSKQLELRDGLVTATLDIHGSADDFDAAREALLARPELRGLRMM